MLLKSTLNINKVVLKKSRFLFLLIILNFFNSKSQVANYISNGSFEDDCPTTVNPIYWPGIDSLLCSGGGFASECPLALNAPLNGFTYQKARTGKGYMISTFFQLGLNIGYLSNRLKHKLVSGKIYCVRFYINISGNSTYGMDSFGAYFGSSDVDTISKCSVPLTYLNPQIQNPVGNIITDTLAWTLITGTFVANGNEKYAVIGNFKSDNLVNKTLIDSTNLPAVFTDVCIDDVSCIPIDLPVYAGPNVSVIPGNSVYIGRPQDVGIDEACTWYKLPNSVPIATAAGIWVSPTQTSTYVVQQQIWCGTVKYDTVVVYMNPLGLASLSEAENEISLYPNPAHDFLELKIVNEEVYRKIKTILIYDGIGQLVQELELPVKDNNSIRIKTDHLSEGIYSIHFRSSNNETLTKKFVVNR